MPAIFTHSTVGPIAETSSPLPPVRDLALVVEDEAPLAMLLSVLLERCGLRVITAANGHDGRALLLSHQAELALLVIDCGLPDSHGGTLSHEFRHLIPRLPILLTSGRAQDALQKLLAADGPTAFLPKPFFSADVVQNVRTLVPNLVRS